MSSAADTIVGIDPAGRRYPIDKLEAHRASTRHLAVSVFVFRSDGRLLLQRRAEAKYHSGGLWANTCCTHPRWGETPSDCAHRRVPEELGFAVPVREFAVAEYAAPVGKLFENEIVHCFEGFADRPVEAPSVNPAEVQEIAWASFDEIAAGMAQAPDRYTPWFRIYIARHLSDTDAFRIAPAA